MTVAVVAPSWAQNSVVYDAAYKNFAAGFSNSLAADLDKILVAKGLKVSGPFRTYDEITYSDKRSADLVLMPVVFLTAQYMYGAPVEVGGGGVVDYVARKLTMTGQGFVEFVLVEALSREKLWVKKLDLDAQTIGSTEAYTASLVNNPETNVPARVDVGPLVFSGKQEAIADAMTQWYPTIAQKAWTYLDIEEMASLKPQVEEIRKRTQSIMR
jgi:hypothetical protein